MVIRQYLAAQWKHVDLREDFVLLHDQGQAKSAERLYQLLIVELPYLPDRALVDDDQRLGLFLAQKNLPDSDLICKYRISVENELQKRVPERVKRALERANAGND